MAKQVQEDRPVLPATHSGTGTLARSRADAQVSPLIYAIVKYGMTLWPRLQGIRVYNHNNVPRSGRVILAGNHQTHLDPFLASLGTPRFVHFMAKKELFDNKLFAFMMSRGGTFPVDRQSKTDIGAIRKALEVLDGEGVLGIFPQGTRGGQEVLDGVSFLALKGKAPIVPMCILKDGPWKVIYGAPIAPEGKVKELTQKVMEAIAALEGELKGRR